MRIALVQQQPTGDLRASVDRGIQALEKAADAGADLVIYPELSFLPFLPQEPARADKIQYAEPIPGPTTELFQDAARQLETVVIINLFEVDGEKTYDSSPVIDADGTLLGVTRMAHITEIEFFHERSYYEPGDSISPVYDTAAGRVAVAICYDRHFPEYLRALSLAGADIVAVPQAGVVGEWPEGLYEAELRVAAFQNGYFMALANRVGSEKAMQFAGLSFVVDPYGVVVTQAPENRETILYADIDLARCADSPARRQFLRNRRPEIYEESLRSAASRPL